MSFSNLRGSSLLYILNKEGVPSVNVGTVINVTAPYGKYGNMAMAFGQQPEQVEIGRASCRERVCQYV